MLHIALRYYFKHKKYDSNCAFVLSRHLVRRQVKRSQADSRGIMGRHKLRKANLAWTATMSRRNWDALERYLLICLKKKDSSLIGGYVLRDIVNPLDRYLSYVIGEAPIEPYPLREGISEIYFHLYSLALSYQYLIIYSSSSTRWCPGTWAGIDPPNYQTPVPLFY